MSGNIEDNLLDLLDTQTQTQGSQLEWSQNTPVIHHENIWGRLYPNNNSKTLGMSNNHHHFIPITSYIDLIKGQFKVGRALHCDYTIQKHMIKSETFWNNISKEHFVITRDIHDPTSPTILHDLSFNGTFVNGEIVGRGKKRILCSKDDIALSHAKAKLFVFMEMIEREYDKSFSEEISKKYFISKVIGTGACGTVRLVYNKMTCGKFAMKIITKKKLTNGQKHTLNDPTKIMNEINILKALKHPSVISTEEVFDASEMVCIVLELMEGGELFDRVSNTGRLSERCTKIIFRQMVLAVKYLHSQGIAHRDLKPENVLLANDDPEPLIKLTDFGLSKLVGEESFMRTMCGTPLYVAPEVLLAEGKSAYGQQVDVWSLGVILFICLSGYVPFSHDYKDLSLKEQIIKGKYMFSRKHWEGVSIEARKLVLKMLCVNPYKRISLSEILQNEWMMDQDVIDRVTELMDNIHDTTEMKIVTNSDGAGVSSMKRVLSIGSQDGDPPAKRRKMEDEKGFRATSTTSSSSDDTVELSIASLSFK